MLNYSKLFIVAKIIINYYLWEGKNENKEIHNN